MEEVKISIIVPVYNLEKLLPKCVESILSQTFTNFELILVNDGSTDKSGEICDNYAKHDSRVRVIHKKNGGVASSRNAGLEIARGNYIGFVDNDDYINHHMFQTLYEIAINHNSDIVVGDYMRVDEDQNIDLNNFQFSGVKTEQLTNIEALHRIYSTDSVTFIYPWNKLYKRHLFKDISYEDGNLYDDESVAHHLLYKCKKITYIQAPLYCYVNRKDSMVNTRFHIKKFGRVYALKDREVFFRKNNEYELHQKALKHYMETFFWYYFMAKINLNGVEKELKTLKSTFNKSLINLLKHREISWKQKIMFILFSLSPRFYQLIIDVTNNKKERLRV